VASSVQVDVARSQMLTVPPNIASGIRVGTPATTTRGFGLDEMRQIGSLIVRAIEGRADESANAQIKASVHDMCARFPVPGLPTE